MTRTLAHSACIFILGCGTMASQLGAQDTTSRDTAASRQRADSSHARPRATTLRVVATLASPAALLGGAAIGGLRGALVGGGVGLLAATVLDVAAATVHRGSAPTTTLCFHPGEPAGPPQIIPGTPAMPAIGEFPGTPGTPNTIIPGTPATPDRWERCGAAAPVQ
jgi:hypothetical protein